MTAVVAQIRPAPDPDLEARVAELEKLVAELAERVPPKRLDVPPGFITIKQAAGLSTYSAPTLYRWARRNAFASFKFGARRYIDPTALPGARDKMTK